MKKRSPPEADEHFEEVCAAPNSKKSDANPACGATQLSDAIWRFETTSGDFMVTPSRRKGAKN
jgi:hypothetical protein